MLIYSVCAGHRQGPHLTCAHTGTFLSHRIFLIQICRQYDDWKSPGVLRPAREGAEPTAYCMWGRLRGPVWSAL